MLSFKLHANSRGKDRNQAVGEKFWLIFFRQLLFLRQFAAITLAGA